MVVQWLGLGAFAARAWVQSLVRELRSCKLHRIKKKKRNFKSRHLVLLLILGRKPPVFHH